MQLVSALFQHYMSLPYQSFTEKLMAALALFKIVQEADQQDFKRLQWIETHTHENINKSLYMMDRCVDPTKGKIDKIPDTITVYPTEKPKNMSQENWENDGHRIRLTVDDIQKYLCLAIREVNDLVVKNMQGYEIERKMKFGEESSDKDDLFSV